MANRIEEPFVMPRIGGVGSTATFVVFTLYKDRVEKLVSRIENMVFGGLELWKSHKKNPGMGNGATVISPLGNRVIKTKLVKTKSVHVFVTIIQVWDEINAAR